MFFRLFYVMGPSRCHHGRNGHVFYQFRPSRITDRSAFYQCPIHMIISTLCFTLYLILPFAFFPSFKQRTLNALKRQHEKRRFKDYTEDLLAKRAIQRYIEKCCRYAWKLVCQTPPYVIQGNSCVLKSDVFFDPVYHQVSREFASAEHNLGLIDIVVWPGLYEGTSGRVIRKTEVLLRAR